MYDLALTNTAFADGEERDLLGKVGGRQLNDLARELVLDRLHVSELVAVIELNENQALIASLLGQL